MKKIFVFLFAILLSMSIVNAAEVKEVGTISVSATASKEVEPDRATIRFYVETDEKTAQDASTINSQKSNKIKSAIKPFLNEKNGDYIKTGNLTLEPVYTYEKNGDKRTLKGYRAKTSFTIDVSDLKKIGQISDVVVKSGVTGFDDFSMYLKNTSAVYNELIVSATKMTLKKANLCANAAGTVLNGIKYINVGSDNINNYRYKMSSNVMLAARAEGSSDGAFSEIEAGKIKLQVNVNAVYYLK